MALTAAQLARVTRMAGEAHKTTRMIDDATFALIAEDVAKVKDSDGNAPIHASYVDTYDLYRVAAEAWREKANMVAEGFDFISEGGEYSRSQVFEHYNERAAHYASQVGSLSMSVGRPVDADDGTSAWDTYLEGIL